MNKIKFPKGERVWVSYYNGEGNLMFILTTKDTNRDYYFLYELINGEFQKIGKSRSPAEIEGKYRVPERMRGAVQ